MRNKVIIGLGALVVLAVIALLVVPAFIDVNHYRPQIESKLRDRLGREVSLGPMKLSFIPLAFRVENAVIAEDPKFDNGRPFAKVQALFVRPRLLPLLHREIEIESLQFNRPSVELIRNQQGIWNFSNLAQGKQGGGSGTFSLGSLKIYDGQIGFTDGQQGNSRSVYDHIDIVLSDFAPDKPFWTEVHAHLPGQGEQTIVLQGKAGPIQHDAVARTPFDGKLSLSAVSLSGVRRFVNIETLANSDAVLTGNAQVKNNNGTFASTGKLEARNARVHGVDIGYPISLDYQVNGDLNQSRATIEKANLKFGPTPVAVQGSIDAKPKPMQVDMTVQASNASIAEAARLAAAFGMAFNAKNDVSGTLNLNVHGQGPVTRPALNGQIAARNVRMSGGELREPVQVDAVELSLSPDAIRSNEFTARTGRTSAAAQFTLSGYVSDSPTLQAKLNTGNADVQELLRIAHAYGLSATEGLNGSGSMTLNVSATGPIRRMDQMTFDGSGQISNTSLDLPSVGKPLGVRRADLRFSGAGVSVDNFDVSLGQTIAHGNLVVRNFNSPQVQFTISANHVNANELEKLFKAREEKGPQPRSGPSATQTAGPGNQENLMSRVSGSGSLTADTVVYDQLMMNNVRSSVTIDHGIVTMKPLTASLYNGQQSGTIVVNTRTTPPTYTVDSSLQNVDANQFLSSISPVKQTLYGLLSANADTHFTTGGGAPGIVPSLNGKVSLNLKDGKVANVDLLHQLATIAQFQRTAKAVEPFTKLLQLTGDFDINKGVARTNNLKAMMDEGSIAADGIVDLAQQKLNMHLTAVLSQQFSQSVGGTNIGGFLNTALANNKGELVIPVIVTGTLQQPQFAPDLQKVAQMKLQKLVPSLDNPAGLTNGILGDILRGKPAVPGEQQQQPSEDQNKQPPDALKDIFGGVLKGKKQQQPK